MGSAGLEVKVGRRLEPDCLSRERKCKQRACFRRDRDLNLMAKGKKEVKKEVSMRKKCLSLMTQQVHVGECVEIADLCVLYVCIRTHVGYCYFIISTRMRDITDEIRTHPTLAMRNWPQNEQGREKRAGRGDPNSALGKGRLPRTPMSPPQAPNPKT